MYNHIRRNHKLHIIFIRLGTLRFQILSLNLQHSLLFERFRCFKLLTTVAGCSSSDLATELASRTRKTTAITITNFMAKIFSFLFYAVHTNCRTELMKLNAQASLYTAKNKEQVEQKKRNRANHKTTGGCSDSIYMLKTGIRTI